MSVGRTPKRTPSKHTLMDKILGREVGAAGEIETIKSLCWYDLTAGDAKVPAGQPWIRGCSPGLLAHHARFSCKPVVIVVFERDRKTFNALYGNLTRELPTLGYHQVASRMWFHRDSQVVFRVASMSGRFASTDDLRESDAVLVFNDPNVITDWAMGPEFVSQIREKTHALRIISTLGCNVVGTKRLPHKTRLAWFDLIDQQAAMLPAHHDLILAAIDGDSSQWAYLISEARKWVPSTKLMADRAFGKHDLRLEMASWRGEPQRFTDIERRLFLTRKELEEGAA